MNTHSFSYASTHVPMIKKMKKWLIIFCVFAFIVMTYSGGLLFIAYNDKIKLNLYENIALISTIGLSLLFMLAQFGQIAKYIAIIKKIKTNGSVNTGSLSLYMSEKTSFGFTMRLLEYIIFTITTLCVFAFSTYAILQFIFHSEVNYYIPILILSYVMIGNSCNSISNNTKMRNI